MATNSLPCTPQDFSPKTNFHGFFELFAHALNNDNKIQKEEFELRISQKLDSYRQNDSRSNPGYDPKRVGQKNISFGEFSALRQDLDLPFASTQLGYSVKVDYDSCFIHKNEEYTGMISIADYIKKLLQQIQEANPGVDISQGVTEKALKIYYDKRNAYGLIKPVETEYGHRYWHSTWSQPFDVGAKVNSSHCTIDSAIVSAIVK